MEIGFALMKNKKIILISSIVFILLITLLVLFLVFKKNKINKNIDEEKINLLRNIKLLKIMFLLIELLRKLIKY